VSAIVRVLTVARRRRWTVLTAVTAFSILAAALSLRLSFGTDVLTLLPQNDQSLQGFRHYLERFGASDHLYIVFEMFQDAPIEEASEVIEAYLGRLRALPEIVRVDAGMFEPGKDWTYLQDRTFALIGPAATREALERFSEQGLRDALVRSRDLLATPSPDIRRIVQSDPLGLLMLVRDRFAGDRSLSAISPSQQGYLSADGRSRLVIASPAGRPFDTAFCRRLFDRLAQIESETRAQVATRKSPPDGAQLRIDYAGGHRIAVETEAIMRREAMFNSVTSVSAILLLLLLVFRSAWLFLVGAIPMFVATLGAIAINGLLRDQLSAAATGTSALLFGLGVDGLVLMYVRYLEELEAGVPAPAAIARLGGAGTSMLLGSFTTAATFFGLTWIDLPGLQELGRLVGVGMVLGGPLTLLLVTALLPDHVKRPRAPSAASLAVFVRRYRWGILVGAGLATAAAIPVLATLDVDVRLQRLQPATPAVRLQHELGQRFGVDRDVALALNQGPSLDALLISSRRFEEGLRSTAPGLPISGPGHLLPPIDEQVETGRILSSVAPNLPAIQARLRAIALDIGFRPGVLDAFIERLPRLVDPEQRLTYQGYLDHGLGDILSRYVARGKDGYTTVTYVEVNSEADLAKVRTASASRDTEVTLTGVPVVNETLAARFGPQLVFAIVAGSVVVLLLMLITFRSVRLTLLALIPTVLGLIWGAAVLAQLGVSLDLFSVFGVLTLIGIGVDYGIHLVHRAANEPGELDMALARVAPANIVAAGIAVLGCGSLAVSTYPPLRSLGIVTVVGLFTCLVAAVLVLPALLMLTTRANGAQSTTSATSLDP
jgi:uncharacterized protein